MLKRKYGDRSDWNRILQREFAQSFLNSQEFTGYITLLHAIQVSKPLFFHYGEKNICIVDNGYMWLQHFPADKNHSVTTMFDHQGNIVQWYIDICLCNGIDNNRPWMDDLFLDIILLPSGEVIEKDADELEEALRKGIIPKQHYDLAWNEAKTLKNSITMGKFELLTLSNQHKGALIDFLK